jgi:hypothetical protein
MPASILESEWLAGGPGIQECLLIMVGCQKATDPRECKSSDRQDSIEMMDRQEKSKLNVIPLATPVDLNPGRIQDQVI